MVKRTQKMQGKRKSSTPEEDDENSSKQKVTVTPAKVCGTPGKQSRGEMPATPGKMAATPGKKHSTPGNTLISPGKKTAEVKKADSKEIEHDDKPEEEDAIDINLLSANGNEFLKKSDEEQSDNNAANEIMNASMKRKKDVPEKSELRAKKPKFKETESFTLLIRNLNSANSFDELKEAIRQFFSEQQFTVCDVRIAGSKKFGYVDFPTEGDLEKALKLNGATILGLEIQMDRAQSYKSSIENKKERTERIMSVKNLPYSTTSDDLLEVFENAVKIRILSSKKKGKGSAFIEFKSAAEVENALKEKQGGDFGGRPMILNHSGEQSVKKPSDLATLVVKNLAYKATVSSLQKVFKDAVSIRIPEDDSCRSKGFALIEFPSKKIARKAMESHTNEEIEGRHVFLELQGAPPEKVKTLFVKGLSSETSEERLKEAFDGALGARIVTDRDTGVSRGFGFVDFSTPEDASAVKEAMEDVEIDGNKVKVDFAKPKGGRARGGGDGGSLVQGRGGKVGRGRGTFRAGRSGERGRRGKSQGDQRESGREVVNPNLKSEGEKHQTD